MNVSLTPKLEAFIRSKVAEGLYGNASAVVREALRRQFEAEMAVVPGVASLTALIARLRTLEPRLRALGGLSASRRGLVCPGRRQTRQ